MSNRIAIPLTALLTCGCAVALSQLTPGGGEGRIFTRLARSKPVTAGGVEFRAEVEDRWDSWGLSVYPVDVRLRITNRSAHPIAFPFADTFGIELRNPDGTLHELDGGRNATRPVIRPLVLGPGEDYTIVPTVRLDRGDGKRRIVYEDGTGTILRSDGLRRGTYSLRFWYRVGKKWNETFGKLRPPLRVWQGETRTEPVAFEFVR